MKKNFFYLLTFCLVCVAGGSVSAQVPSALKTFVGKESLKHAAIGFKAVGLTDGKILADYNSRVSLTPASNMKLVTTATALELLGERFCYETLVFSDGIVKDSVLEGNLYIRGMGDPTLGSEYFDGEKEDFLRKWLAGIQKAGVRYISGDVVALDQLFGYEGVSHKWLWEDLGNYYAPGIYGISIFDNSYRVYLQSYSIGTKTLVLSVEPEMADIVFTNDITAGDADEPAVFGLPFSFQRRLYGTIPPDKSSYVLRGDIPDPGLFLANYLKTYLRKNGIEVKGKGTTFRLNPQLPVVQTILINHQSPPLADIARVTNVKSNNHFAECLFQTLKVSKETDIPAYWEEKKLDASALFMYEGSGTSPANAVSTGFLTDLLVYMDKKEGKKGAFYRSLPVAGKDGTVASFLKKTPLEGKVHLKSGSITRVQSYSGYVEKGEKRYAFSLIVNRFSGKRALLRKDMEQLLVDLF